MLNKEIESFYMAALDYAGLKYENSIIVNNDPAMGDITVDNEYLTLPYFDNLKNQSNRKIFHLLNESYNDPETEVFDIYKKRLTVEINIRLSSLIINLITVASDSLLQQKIKSSKLANIIANFPPTDGSCIEAFLQTLKASKKANEENFLVGFYVKKNGTIGNTPYKSICKINFPYFKELSKANSENGYKVFGTKLRKKDVLSIEAAFRSIFDNIEDEQEYTQGSDSKIFRCLEALLKATEVVSSRINYVSKELMELKEPTLKCEELIVDTSFIDNMHELEKISREIRVLPSEIDPAKQPKENTRKEVPQFNPQTLTDNQPNQHQTQQHQHVNQAPAQLTPEDIIRGNMAQPQYQNPMPVPMPAPMPQSYPPGYGYPPAQPMPAWMVQEMNRNATQGAPVYQNPPMTNMGMPQMYPNGYYPQQQMPGVAPFHTGISQQTPYNPNMYQQHTPYPMYPNMQQPQQSNTGLSINPAMFGGASAPFN
jgi:hypothetical protein